MPLNRPSRLPIPFIGDLFDQGAPMIRRLAQQSAVLVSVWSLFVGLHSASAQSAQRTATTTATAPVFGSPNANQTPLRVARAGSVLLLINTNAEWTQVEFQD